MHRATPAAGHAGLAAKELGHDAVRLDTAGDGVAVLTVVGEQVIIWLHASRQANARGLLTQIEVAVTADLGSLVHLRRLLLEATDEQHLAVVGKQFVRRGGSRDPVLRARAWLRRERPAVCGGAPRGARSTRGHKNLW